MKYVLVDTDTGTVLQSFASLPEKMVVHDTLVAYAPTDKWEHENYAIKVIEDEPEVFVEPDPMTKNQLYNHAENKRYITENSEISVWGNKFFADRFTRAYIFELAKRSEAVYTWKTSNRQFIQVTLSQLQVAADKIIEFVENCFKIEHMVFDMISNGTITTTEQIDAEFEKINKAF